MRGGPAAEGTNKRVSEPWVVPAAMVSVHYGIGNVCAYVCAHPCTNEAAPGSCARGRYRREPVALGGGRARTAEQKNRSSSLRLRVTDCSSVLGLVQDLDAVGFRSAGSFAMRRRQPLPWSASAFVALAFLVLVEWVEGMDAPSVTNLDGKVRHFLSFLP